MGEPARHLVKEAIEYVKDIENNIPKHFWPGLVRAGWMVIEEDGTPNWDYSVTSKVSNENLVDLMVHSRADIYFYKVGQFMPLKPNLGEEEGNGYE